MKERPILFSGDMVRAILEGRKTQTRRVVSDANGAFWDHPGYKPCIGSTLDDGKMVVYWRNVDTLEIVPFAPSPKCPYGQPGDRLWVRETWGWHTDGRLVYKADKADEELESGRWHSSIHLFRWMSRITLEITSVRISRLNEITEDDCEAEGVTPFFAGVINWYRPAFEILWDKINGRKYSWASNPWVWVIAFKIVWSA